MSELPEAPPFITPSAITTALLGLFVGAASMAYNPFFAASVIAVALSVLTLRNAGRVEHSVVQGVLRALAVLGIIGGLGGVIVLAFPVLGVQTT
jgi:hypothetical protein